MFLDGIKKFLGLDPNERALKKYSGLVDIVNSYSEGIHAKSDQEIKSRFQELKSQAQDNPDSLDDLLPEVFAIVREVSDRTIGLRHYDVQLIGGMALHDGRIAEMKTGEGKTLVATLAVVLNAMKGEGVHLVTVNDYLAGRDAEWMQPIYNFLGLSVGVIYPYMPDEERLQAYNCDITYGTNSEFGFDYLRDNMAMRLSDKVQRGHSFCIVDEVDSILIDEARTPLIISGPSDDDTGLYVKADNVARTLKEGVDYEKDEKERSISITEAGIQKCEEYLKMPGLFSELMHSDLAHRINQALKAHTLYKRDIDYVVKDGEIIIVDEFTGRLMIGRRYSEGLHQAIEAKERVKIGRESQTLATITLQNYFRMYRKLAGMTGTAATESEEFKEIYGLEVITIPTHKEMIRVDFPDVIFATEHEKFKAVTDEVEDCYKRGQPVLVGTTSIENSERVSKLLKARKIPHHVLNAKYHEKEAYIVAQAGREKAVTVATNMAGRGTDIMLGGNPEFLAREKVNASENPEDSTLYEKYLQEYSEKCKAEHDRVVNLGGLAIIGTERHESRRIDNQLRGRSGRQGDPGASRFYLSLEDNLLRLFGSDRIQPLMGKLGMKDGEAIESSMLTKIIENSQKKVEEMHFDIRKQLLAYDNVMNQQREAVYSEREDLLSTPDDEMIIYGWDIMKGVIDNILDKYFPEDNSEPSPERAASKLRTIFGAGAEGSIASVDNRLDMEGMKEEIYSLVKAKYDSKIQEFRDLSESAPANVVRGTILYILDNDWREHLTAMDELRRGIGLRAIGQKDPLIEYQFESYNLFQEMMEHVKNSFCDRMLRSRVVTPRAEREKLRLQFSKPEFSSSTSSQPNSQQPALKKLPKVGRNDPCPCGSGKKYKYCHGRGL
ncbi:MAG: preprotein translocase subunit SecA [Synergistaceae bacterium]|nr:preprotein translocase subunit SecA [Synergistaceae bacterium]